MGLIRYLIIGALLYLAGWALRRVLRKLTTSSSAEEKRTDVGVATVRCDYCGLFLPKTDAYASGERFFCSEEHRRHAR